MLLEFVSVLAGGSILSLLGTSIYCLYLKGKLSRVTSDLRISESNCAMYQEKSNRLENANRALQEDLDQAILEGTNAMDDDDILSALTRVWTKGNKDTAVFNSPEST